MKKNNEKENPKDNKGKPNQSTHIIITNRSKINTNLNKNNDLDLEANKTPRNKNQDHIYKKNYNSPSYNQSNIYSNTIPTSSQRTNNLIQFKLNKDVKNEQKNSKTVYRKVDDYHIKRFGRKKEYLFY